MQQLGLCATLPLVYVSLVVLVSASLLPLFTTDVGAEKRIVMAGTSLAAACPSVATSILGFHYVAVMFASMAAIVNVLRNRLADHTDTYFLFFFALHGLF